MARASAQASRARLGEPVGREVRGRDDRGRVADEDAQAGAPLARALELLDRAQADADLEPVALARERVGRTRARRQRVADQALGDVAQVAGALTRRSRRR